MGHYDDYDYAEHMRTLALARVVDLHPTSRVNVTCQTGISAYLLSPIVMGKYLFTGINITLSQVAVVGNPAFLVTLDNEFPVVASVLVTVSLSSGSRYWLLSNSVTGWWFRFENAIPAGSYTGTGVLRFSE